MNMKKKWWHKSVVYQIYPRSFYDSNGDGIGDLPGIIEKVQYLAELGIDVIWLSPVYRSPNADNGYDISNYYSIMEEFGTMDDMKTLIRVCKESGIRIIMDLVVNHTSDEHPWFLESRSSRDNPFRNYYIWRDPAADGGPPNNLKSNFGGSAWEYDSATGQYYLHFYHKKQPDLNWENAEMRKAIWEMMNYWISLGIGGFRMDVVDLLGKVPDQGIKENGPRLHEYLQEMNRCTFGDKDLLTVGEAWGATPEIGRLYSDPPRKELSMIFQFEQVNLDKIPGKQRWDLKQLDLSDLKAVMERWQKGLDGRGWNSLFWNNHDLPRIVSRWGNDGEYRTESAKMLATLLHGMKGTPYIYQGEEIGMTNVPFDDISQFIDIETKNIYQERLEQGMSHKDIMRALRAKARDNARTPMQWDSSPNAGFTKGIPWYLVNPNYKAINVDNALKDHDSIYYHYKKLISLRRQEDTLVYGSFELIERDHPDVFSYTRKYKGKTLAVVCNFYSKTVRFSWQPSQGKNADVLLSNYPDSGTRLSDLLLRPYEAVIYHLSD